LSSFEKQYLLGLFSEATKNKRGKKTNHTKPAGLVLFMVTFSYFSNNEFDIRYYRIQKVYQQ